MLRFGTSVSYGGADTPRSDQGAGADPALTQAERGWDAGSNAWGGERPPRTAPSPDTEGGSCRSESHPSAEKSP